MKIAFSAQQQRMMKMPAPVCEWTFMRSSIHLSRSVYCGDVGIVCVKIASAQPKLEYILTEITIHRFEFYQKIIVCNHWKPIPTHPFKQRHIRSTILEFCMCVCVMVSSLRETLANATYDAACMARYAMHDSHFSSTRWQKKRLSLISPNTI